MDDIQLVITRTKKQCKEKGGLTVSDKLAAFVSRTVIYENLTKFQLDKELTEEAIDELVQINTEVSQAVPVDGTSFHVLRFYVSSTQSTKCTTALVNRERTIGGNNEDAGRV